MADSSKYDILLNDLDSIETRISILTQHYKNIFEKNLKLEETIDALKKENINLHQKISELGTELEKIKEQGAENLFSSLSVKERDTLKVKLQDLITRIDYHLSS